MAHGFTSHKIPGVDRSVCTAEQMIAYNFAQNYKEMSAEWCACTARAYMRDNRKFDKFNHDLICHLIATRKGKTYFGKIASSYKEVGEYFPLP